jgi:hypothetical protein
MLRISTTTLESFRLWSAPDQEWMSENDLRATIRGEFVPTPEVLLGQAFGKVLEDPDRFLVEGGFRYCEHYFTRATMEPALALMDHEHGVFEAKATKEYGDCLVVSRADQLVGSDLKEHKTTTGYFNLNKYTESYQWRFMLDAFNVRRVTYLVFLLEEHPDRSVDLRGIETLRLYRYPGLHDDCAELVRRFREYVTLRGLDDLLRARETTTPALA